MASFTYYGSVLGSSELLEKNLLCVTDADQEHQIKHRLEDGLCYCIPFAMNDYQTLLISSLGEVACESQPEVPSCFKMHHILSVQADANRAFPILIQVSKILLILLKI